MRRIVVQSRPGARAQAFLTSSLAALLVVIVLLPATGRAAAPPRPRQLLPYLLHLARSTSTPLAPAPFTTVPRAPLAAGSGTNVDVSAAQGPQSESSIAATAAYSPSLVAGSNDISLFSAMDAYSSLDGGKTWARVKLAPPLSATLCAFGLGGLPFTSDPNLGARANGVYFYAYISVCSDLFQTKVSSEVDMRASFDGGRTWLGAIPVVSTIGDTTHLQDKEQLTVDNNPGSPTNGRIYVAWTETFGQVQHIELAWSDTYGFTWHAPVQVDTNGSGGVIFAEPVVGPDGRVYVVWNDYGQDASGSTSLIQFAASANVPVAAYVPTFTTNATVAHSGINLNAPVAANTACSPLVTLLRIQDIFCLPAQPDRGISADPSVLVDSMGRLYILWTQGQLGSPVTDVEVQTSADRGATWSAPVQVNDDNTPGAFSSGASDFFPAGALDPATGALHVTFYSTRLDAANQTTNIYDALVTVAGDQLAVAPNSRVSTASSNESVTNPFRDPNNYGDYEGVAMQAGAEHPVWTDSRYPILAQEEIFSTSR